MKIKNFFLSLLLLSLVIVFGCMRSTQSVVDSSPSITKSPINSPSSVNTFLPTITTVPISTPTKKPELTTIPTLPTEDARQKLLDLLSTNGGCQLPCLWGITPGKSSFQEARLILMPLLSIAEVAHFDSTSPEDISPIYIDSGYLRLYTRLDYIFGIDNIVNHTRFEAREEEVITDSEGNWLSKRPVYDSATFNERIEYYSLSHVLTMLGIPSTVMVKFSGLTGYPVVAGGLDIALLYPEQGVWINYEMPINNQGNIKRGCPVNANVEMELYPQGTPDSFYANLDKTDWGVTKKEYKPLEEATSMSEEGFYETFRNPTDACIESLASIWPTPEFNQ